MFGGSTGPFRLLNSALGDQAGWLLGFALVAGLALLVSSRLRRRDPNTGWLIAVGGAFVTTAVVFSFASGIFHPYYVSLLAPFTAALIGAGVGLILADAGAAPRVIAPLAIAAGAVTELDRAPRMERAAVVGGFRSSSRSAARAPSCSPVGVGGRVRLAVLGVALAALFAAPATWAAETIGHATNGTFPTGGPAVALEAGGPRMAGSAASAAPSAASAGGARRVRRPRRLRQWTFVRRAGRVRGGRGAPGASAVASPPGPRQRRSAPHPGRRPAGGGFGGRRGAASAAAAARSGATPPRSRARSPTPRPMVAAPSPSRARARPRRRSSPRMRDVAGIGGFSGRESSVTASWVAMEVASGRLRWVLADGTGGFGAPGDTRTGSQAAIDVVEQACRADTDHRDEWLARDAVRLPGPGVGDPPGGQGPPPRQALTKAADDLSVDPNASGQAFYSCGLMLPITPVDARVQIHHAQVSAARRRARAVRRPAAEAGLEHEHEHELVGLRRPR
jgi:hypothetical protein